MNKWSKAAARWLLPAALAALLTGCAATAGTPAPDTREPEAPAQETQVQDAEMQNTSKVADASQMTTVEEVVEEGMTPVYAESVKPGVYNVKVESSSSMFKITDCELTVQDGAMTALLTMSGSSYAYVYPGTAEEAAAADETQYIAAGESADGKNTFVLPVSALDAGVPCAAWSKNKELWYDRTLVFRSDALPLDAFKILTTAESLDLVDGTYTVTVTLAGGSGKASVQSPATLTVENGVVTAEIVWSSANYDYMLVSGERYDAEIRNGHSIFVIPVAVFNHPLAVVADTTAMSRPYEIDYTLTFDSSTLEQTQW